MSIRVLLVDDHVMIREALRTLLERTPDIEVVGEASDGGEVEELVLALSPDVVVMDVSLPTISGIEATRELLAHHTKVQVVGLSAFVYKRFVLEMMSAGALGYVAKSAACDELVRAIKNVAQGKTYICPEAAATLVDATRRDDRTPRGPSKDSRLGRREREVLCLLAEGKTAPQIAQVLFIAPTTVNVHRRNIMRKLNLHGVAELTKYAIREGLIST
ncbi:MAG: response regulator transcription factor [Zoogloea sp.]|jgi:two-component system NarL family response regulator|nr:response regulator transcription factor [Zoogloea sp.]